MSIFGDLKNMVTGGAATVSAAVVGEVKLGVPATVQVRAQAHANIEIDSVYVIIRLISTRDHAVRGEHGDESETEYEEKLYLAGIQELVAGQTYSWETQFTIPVDKQVSKKRGEGWGGRFDYDWKLFAGLERLGNDPDSGWQPFLVKAD
ncbi:MAG TPA: hypothetical protein VGM39_19220 [Kofleriaceae bacterium]